MPEYIERENAIAWFMPYAHAGENIDADIVISDIKGMKTADVTPVVHGKWEWCKDCDGDSILVCSECGRVCHEEDAPYCYCGAKMDGKSNVPRTEGE